ncbi:MAG TPA: UDP-N-acetylglucosamine diphosphorylase/glucosamine-1-phosphate N-acetyltransferase [Gammaproteobacteria bacterium]|nr:UDP-N-acetylglucosamine diphosphorylase/glucosamine-1-phosphate N-acetyltransferase [Gammaproteobacteria bacterium]
MNGTLAIVILAAGQGTRMRSSRPKVLHELAGRPLLRHVIHAASALDPDEIVVVAGHGADLVRDAIRSDHLRWAIQEEQLGTGHAVQVAMPAVTADKVLILYGDVPLIRADLLKRAVAGVGPGRMNLVTIELDDPTGYGRIVRGEAGEILRIVEQKDADEATLAITEGNTGIICASREDLAGYLNRLKNDNAQGEYYLTDCIECCIDQGGRVEGILAERIAEVAGVNNKQQLNELERGYQLEQAERLMAEGVTLADKHRFDLRGNLKTGQDVFIDFNCLFTGDVELGSNVSIGPNCVISDSIIGDNVTILPNCVIEGARIEAGCTVGPFARLRPEAHLHDNAKVGNFVEIKKSEVGEGSKVNHLSYIGDTHIGQHTNIGAGTITCNYDGVNKHQTTIGDDVFVGSNTALVAPIVVESGATIGAGSTITRDAPANTLNLGRAKQVTIETWKRPRKRD